MRIARRAIMLAALPALAARAEVLRPLAWDATEAAELIAALRRGGLVLFFRHADTLGEPCDRIFDPARREGQRGISPRGRAQSREIGARLAALGIPIAWPALAGPVFRARDTAELAFGAERVEVTDSLLADDFAHERLGWVLAEHRRLFSTPPPAGLNRVLVGHRTPAIMVAGRAVGGTAFPEGAALVLRPSGDGFAILGVVMFAPIPGAGFHAC